MNEPEAEKPPKIYRFIAQVCPTCGCREVQTLDWVDVNTGELEGGDAGADYFCPHCDEGITHTVEKDFEIELCGTCEAHRWGTHIPIPGVIVSAEGWIERCDDCPIHTNDYQAALAVQAEAAMLSIEGVRVRFIIEGYEVE